MMLLLSLLAATASARVMDKLAEVPRDWKEVRVAKPEERIALRVALHQQHADALEQVVLEMSSPGHVNYGRHLTRDELRSYTAPSQTATDVVAAWLSEHGITPSVDNDWMLIQTNVSAANALLDTRFAWYQYAEGGSPQLRTLSYSIPDELAAHVDLIQPTTRFGQLGPKKSTIFDLHVLDDVPVDHSVAQHFGNVHTTAGVKAANVTCPNGLITPDCLKALYNINYTAKPEGNLVAVASYLQQYARYNDLAAFEQTYVPSAIGQNFSVTLFNGGIDGQNSTHDSGEANLDVQYVLGISHPVPLVEFSTGGLGPLVPTPDQPNQPGSNEPYFEFLTNILALPDSSLPQTLSTSYGEEEQSVPKDYALKVCNMFMQLGARGVSVIFSSGDSGPGNSCVDVNTNATFFNPTFPAGCPYVTSVGATTGQAPEKAVGFSSGGFSIYHDRPGYQNCSVPAYLRKINGTYSSFFNATGRGIPDVAAQGNNFVVINKNRTSLLAGTSASAPTFAGIVALLNAARKTQGQPPLGFLNPWLYRNRGAFTDITTGAGKGCFDVAPFGATGALFNATTGWDPVTGLGTPLFDKLLAVAAPGVANV